MKSINKIILNNIKVVSETNYFRTCIGLILIFSIYGGYLSARLSYLNGFILILTDATFFVLGVLMPFLVITLCTYVYFDKNIYLIARLKTKKEYLKYLILTVFIMNLFVYFLMLIMVMIALNLFLKSGLGFQMNFELHCHNFIYLIFIIIRLFCLMEIISICNVLLCRKLNSKIIIVLNVVLYGILFGSPYLLITPVDNIFSMPLFIGNYLIITRYESFGLELFCTMIYIFILSLVNMGLFKIVKNRIGDIQL